jgi:hypothetical protein
MLCFKLNIDDCRLPLIGRGGMGSKIDAASSAVAPGSACSACVIASGGDLNSIRAVLGKSAEYGKKGTLFCSPGSLLEKQALGDLEASKVRPAKFRSTFNKKRSHLDVFFFNRLQLLAYQTKLVRKPSTHELKLASCRPCPTRVAKTF